MRPPGDPVLIAAAAGRMATAADELERLGYQVMAAASDLVAGGEWDGPASREYFASGGALETEMRVAAGALRIAGKGLGGLSSGLAAAQATWDRAGALAASSGLALDPAAPSGPLALPLPSTDPRVAVAARVSDLLHEADEQASAADRKAAATLTEAGGMAAAAYPDRSPARGTAAAPGWAAPGRHGTGEPERHGDGSVLGRALDLAERVGVAFGAGFAAIEERGQALLRMARSGREPEAALGAVRTLAGFERSALLPTLTALLPMAGPPLTLAANFADHEHEGEPVLRTVVRSLGEAIGADAGQRLGLAVCGVDVGATGGVGAVLCPAITIVGTSAGAALGGAAAVRIYDALGPEPGAAREPEPARDARDRPTWTAGR
jgi:hypothetical protein